MKFILENPINSIQPFILDSVDESLNTLVVAAKRELALKVVELSDGQKSTWGFFPNYNPLFLTILHVWHCNNLSILLF